MCATLAALSSSAVRAASPPPGPARLLEKLASCGEVSDRDARLACYEAAAAALKAGVARGDIVVVDREQAQDVRRQAFGFELPSLSLFGGGDKLEKLAGRLAGARRGADGAWTFELESGQAWTQVDTDPLLVTPRAGMPVEVKKSRLDAYFLDVDGHAGVRVRRVR